MGPPSRTGHGALLHPHHPSRAHSKARAKSHMGTPELCPGRGEPIRSWAQPPPVTDPDAKRAGYRRGEGGHRVREMLAGGKERL